MTKVGLNVWDRRASGLVRGFIIRSDSDGGHENLGITRTPKGPGYVQKTFLTSRPAHLDHSLTLSVPALTQGARGRFKVDHARTGWARIHAGNARVDVGKPGEGAVRAIFEMHPMAAEKPGSP